MPKTTPWDDLRAELLADPELRAEVERLEPERQAARARYLEADDDMDEWHDWYQNRLVGG